MITSTVTPSADIIINLYVDASKIDQNAINVNVSSVILPGTNEDDDTEVQMYHTLADDIHRLASRASDYPQLDRLLSQHDAVIQPNQPGGFTIGYRQARLATDPAEYYKRGLVVAEIVNAMLQNVFRTSSDLRGMTFDVSYSYSRRLAMEQEVHDVLLSKKLRYDHLRICMVVCVGATLALLGMFINTGHMLDNPNLTLNIVEWIAFLAMLASGFYGLVCYGRMKQYHRQLLTLLEHLRIA